MSSYYWVKRRRVTACPNRAVAEQLVRQHGGRVFVRHEADLLTHSRAISPVYDHAPGHHFRLTGWSAERRLYRRQK